MCCDVTDQTAKQRVHAIACGVLAIDLQATAERLGLELTMEFLPGGLHSRPHELRQRLQEAVDKASAARQPDAIAVGYGVCGLGTVGIHARNVPLILPKVNDCIALFLGSDEAYKAQFAAYPGTYYIAAGWVEEKSRPFSSGREGGAEVASGTADGPRRDVEAEYDRLVGKYGRENADAIRHFLTSWQRNYQRAAFIDTGVGPERKRYAEIARAMAEEFGWRYERLEGTDALLARLLTAQRTDGEVLLCPPHHVTAFDAVSKTLRAVPVWEADGPAGVRQQTLVFPGEPGEDGEADDEPVRLGLGIDAGGTYTDAVLFDFAADAPVVKAKAPTTPWDYAAGIAEALDRLDADRLAEADLVAVSTTLATNAIVEGRGQPVGLLIMPPYGLFEPSDIAHRPLEVLAGRLEIDGTELEPPDLDHARRAAAEMVDTHGVGAFAVAGYASHNNPAHELAVKDAVREATGLGVTCGHEVSEGLNYRVRAATAALNARIIPVLAALLEKVREELLRRGIGAPVLVVKSDGSLMNVATALERPIETILSGPAASVAGASHLAGSDEAIVVDIGGTTTDTASISAGRVQTCEDGASVGGWRTHVRALDLRTCGLGGDSRVVLNRGELEIGPRRVAPVGWLGDRDAPGAREAVAWVERHIDRLGESTLGGEMLCLNGQPPEPRTDEEARVLSALSERPHCLDELARRVGAIDWRLLKLGDVENTHRVQRCGLTPTDLLHAAGRAELWDTELAARCTDVFARLAGLRREGFVEMVLGRFVRRLAMEVLTKQLDDRVDGEELTASPAARALLDNAFAGGDGGLEVRLALKRPIVGIGAPVHCFLPDAAALLSAEAIIPPDADVANAIGAVTSRVRVSRQVRIVPNEHGRYAVHGLSDSPAFRRFEEAHAHAVEALQRLLRRHGRRAGTRAGRVEVVVDDRVAATADGGQVFLGRTLEGHLSGRPDIARLARAGDESS